MPTAAGGHGLNIFGGAAWYAGATLATNVSTKGAFGGVEARAFAGLGGFGGHLALGWDRFRRPVGESVRVVDALAFGGALRWSPLVWFLGDDDANDLLSWADPHVELGWSARFFSARPLDEPRDLRGGMSAWVGPVVDLRGGFVEWDWLPAVVVGWQWRFLRGPPDLDAHRLLVGIGLATLD